MKILFIIPSISNGGQEKAGMILCNYLMQFHSVTALCLEPASDKEFNYQCPIVRVAYPVKKSLFGKIAVVIKRVIKVNRIKKQLKPDVSISFGDTAIILNHFTGGSETKIASLRHSFKNAQLAKGFTDNFREWLYNYTLKKADKIVPVSHEINKELKQLFNIDNSLFVTNGYELDDIHQKAAVPLPTAVAPFFNDKVIVHSGRYDATKCHFQLVKIFDLVRSQSPTAKLLLLGGIDLARDENRRIYEFCISYLQQKGYKIIFAGKSYSPEETAIADVLVLGHQMNPFQYLSKATLFVFPSALEGFPNALMEAMVCGLPVVSADCPTGPKEILLDNETGESFGVLLPVFDHVFNSQDYNSHEDHLLWAKKISEILSDESSLRSYREQSLKRARQYSVESVCKKWLQILDDTKM